LPRSERHGLADRRSLRCAAKSCAFHRQNSNGSKLVGVLEDGRSLFASQNPCYGLQPPIGEPRRVRCPWRFRAAAMPRNVDPCARNVRISSTAACSFGSGSTRGPSAASRDPNSRLPMRSLLLLLCRGASRLRSLIASRSHWLTTPIIVITQRPAAVEVSSDSATEIRARFRFSNSSMRLQRSLTLRVSRSSFATITAFFLRSPQESKTALQEPKSRTMDVYC
jgi:hypothetical protein